MKHLYLFLTFSLLFAAYSQADNGNETDSTDATEEKTDIVSLYDTSAIYTEDWNNNVTFWYPKINYADSTMLKLTDFSHGYAFPIEKKTTAGFGRRHSSHHKGIDIPLKTGDPVVSAFDGKVRYAKWNSGGFGFLVIVRHPNGLETYYAHLSKIKVKPNQIVTAGELVGLGGSTGRSYSPHLHFEVRYNHRAFDPEKIFNLESFCLKQEEAMVCELISGKKVVDHSGHSHGSFQKSTADLSQGKVYSIKSGDSLSKIAGANGTTVDALCKLNGMTRSTILHIGQKVRVK